MPANAGEASRVSGRRQIAVSLLIRVLAKISVVPWEHAMVSDFRPVKSVIIRDGQLRRAAIPEEAARAGYHRYLRWVVSCIVGCSSQVSFLCYAAAFIYSRTWRQHSGCNLHRW